MKKLIVGLILVMLLVPVSCAPPAQPGAPPAPPVPAPAPSPPAAAPTPAEEIKNKNIIIDGVMNEWSSTALMISDPYGDISSNVVSEKGVDLKAVYALMDESYLYVAIQVYGGFDLSLLRNYFIALDFDKDQQDEYHFGVRPGGDTWVFDHTRDKNNWNGESTFEVAAIGEGDTIEIRIPRKYYKIPASILIYCRVTEGGPTVDSTRWFEVSQTEIHEGPDVELGSGEAELKYDNGTSDGTYAIGRDPGRGHAVHFSPPATPFTINEVKIYGSLYGTGYEKLLAHIEVLDEDFNILYNRQEPHTKFSSEPSWLSVSIPDIVVDGDFYILVGTTSPREGGINIHYDSSVVNKHSEVTEAHHIADWYLRIPKEVVNWMIRVSGTYMPSSEPEPTPEPISEEIELKYDDGVARNYISVFPPLLTGYLVDFTPPHIPFTIKKVQMHGELSGSGWEGKNFEVEIWDKDRKVLYRATLPVTLFPQYPKHDWAEIEIPDIEVADKFYVHVYTGTGIGEGIHIGADDSISNEHSNVTVREGETDKQLDYWPYSPSVWFGDKSKVNWMIRVVGTTAD